MESNHLKVFMKRKFGEIFKVNIGRKARFFQYLIDDSTQLNSNVICIFKATSELDETISVDQIRASGIDFFAHVLIKLGEKLGMWEPYSKAQIEPCENVWFRDSPDYGNPNIRVTRNWWLWRANETRSLIKGDDPRLSQSHIGVVIAPANIMDRLVLGQYQFVYPKYENQADTEILSK